MEHQECMKFEEHLVHGGLQIKSEPFMEYETTSYCSDNDDLPTNIKKEIKEEPPDNDEMNSIVDECDKDRQIDISDDDSIIDVTPETMVNSNKTPSSGNAFICGMCSFETTTRHSLICHLRTHTGGEQFTCKLCDYQAKTKVDLNVHMRTHTGEKPFACSICDHKTNTKTCLINHIRTHTGEKPFSCSMCDYKATTKPNVSHHIKAHHCVKPYKCSLCDYSAVKRVGIELHMKVHSQQYMQRKRFTCSLCDYKTNESSSLFEHVGLYHCKTSDSSSLYERMGTKHCKKLLSCSVCDYKTFKRRRLIVHVRMHISSRPFKCEKCSYCTDRMASLRRHELLTHSVQKTFACAECTYIAANRSDYLSHIRLHTYKNPFSCIVIDSEDTSDDKNSLKLVTLLDKDNTISGPPTECQLLCNICDYRAPTRLILKNHIRKHTGEKPFRCGKCEYRTSWKVSLDRHIMLNHIGKLPYTCKICDYASSQKKDLMEHIRAHTYQKHNLNAEQPAQTYSCNICGYLSITKANLYIHMRVHPSNETPSCELCNNEDVTKQEEIINRIRAHDDGKSSLCPRHLFFVNQDHQKYCKKIPKII